MTAAPKECQPEATALRQALEECVSVLAMVERPAAADQDYGEEVAALGNRIGYGALMTSASASWRARLEEEDCPTGGEFVAGPCYATVLATLKQARAALASLPLPEATGGREVEPRWTEDELALAFFDYSACVKARCTFDKAKPCPCATEAYKAVHWIKHVLPRSLPLASPVSSTVRGAP